MVLACYALLGKENGDSDVRATLRGILFYLSAYTVFFIWWTPNEPFIFAAPVVLPFWLLLHARHVRQQEAPMWRVGMLAACVAIVLNNALFASHAAGFQVPKYVRVPE